MGLFMDTSLIKAAMLHLMSYWRNGWDASPSEGGTCLVACARPRAQQANLRNYLKNTVQPNMMAAVQGLYTGNYYLTNQPCP